MTASSNNHDADWLETWLVEQGRLIGSERPPTHLRRRLIDLFDSAAMTTPLDDLIPGTKSFDPIDFELAQLLFDERYDLAASGTRGSVDSGLGYALAYTSMTADVVLHVQALGTEINVRGQVLARTPSEHLTVRAAVAGSARAIAAAACDTHGRFDLGTLTRTDLELTVDSAATRLLIRLPSGSDDGVVGA
jgi:hypothetical protein